MIIVSDTSVISNLAQVGEIEILNNLYSSIIIPKAVNDELKADFKTNEIIEKLDWISIREISDISLYNSLVKDLDPGESEAIVLAKELGAELLMIDERKGRKIAKDHGVSIIGILGLLIEAKRKKLLKSVKPTLDKLIYEIGFRVSPSLYQHILSTVNEN